jgi:hypothetical protein
MEKAPRGGAAPNPGKSRERLSLRQADDR